MDAMKGSFASKPPAALDSTFVFYAGPPSEKRRRHPAPVRDSFPDIERLLAQYEPEVNGKYCRGSKTYEHPDLRVSVPPSPVSFHAGSSAQARPCTTADGSFLHAGELAALEIGAEASIPFELCDNPARTATQRPATVHGKGSPPASPGSVFDSVLNYGTPDEAILEDCIARYLPLNSGSPKPQQLRRSPPEHNAYPRSVARRDDLRDASFGDDHQVEKNGDELLSALQGTGPYVNNVVSSAQEETAVGDEGSFDFPLDVPSRTTPAPQAQPSEPVVGCSSDPTARCSDIESTGGHVRAAKDDVAATVVPRQSPAPARKCYGFAARSSRPLLSHTAADSGLDRGVTKLVEIARGESMVGMTSEGSDSEEMPFIPRPLTTRSVGTATRRRDAHRLPSRKRPHGDFTLPAVVTKKRRLGKRRVQVDRKASGDGDETSETSPGLGHAGSTRHEPVHRRSSRCFLVEHAAGSESWLSIELPMSCFRRRLGESPTRPSSTRTSSENSPRLHKTGSHGQGASRSRYTEEEDCLLVELKKRRTPTLSWNEISQHFPRRTTGSLQVRYCTRLKKGRGSRL